MDDVFSFVVNQYHRSSMEHLFVLFDDDYFLEFSNLNKLINKIKKRKEKELTDDVREGRSVFSF